MSRSIEAIRGELAEVTDALIAVATDDFVLRHELLTRRDALRDEASRFAEEIDGQRPTRDIVSELAGARTRRDTLVRDLAARNLMTSPGSKSTAGVVSGAMVTLALEAKAASGLDAIVARVSALESALESRGVDVERALQDQSVPTGTAVRAPEAS